MLVKRFDIYRGRKRLWRGVRA